MHNVRQFVSILIALVLIGLGVLFLLDNLGFLSVDPVNIVVDFWPVVLIILGLYFIWGRTQLKSQTHVQEVEISEDIGDAAKASLKVDFGAGELNIGPHSAGDKLLSGRFLYRPGMLVRHSSGSVFAELKQSEWPWSTPFSWMPGDVWNLNLNQTIPIAIELNTGASRILADLSEYTISELALNTGASDVTIRLPAHAGFTHAVIKGGATSIRLEVPSGVSARIKSSSALANITINQDRFIKGQSGYESADYDSATNKVDIDINTGVSSVTVI